MGVFVYLPLVLPLTALPVARLAEQHLHPRTAARLLTAVAAILAVCSTVCLALLVVVGTAQLPGNPLPDSWSDPEVRAAVPYDEVTGKVSIGALAAVLTAWAGVLLRHRRYRAKAHRALSGLGTDSEVAVLRDDEPYAYALPSAPRGGALSGAPRRPGRILVSTGMLAALTDAERHALLAHERAHLVARHHRLLLAVQLAGCANPLLRPLREAVTYCTERWADEEAAAATGDRRTTARAVAKAALVTPRPSSRARPGRTAFPGLPAFAATGPVPRRVAALLGPLPPANGWPPALTGAGIATATLVAAAGTAASTFSALNASVALFCVLEAASLG
ncbi:M56 family metallopeptidase [Streptomyces candidus]|uniref:M56 family metallopeptidase n=1 Tax=Streptomyces candidus TaxID=67283 RepID=UPI00160DE062|nr:M56 family metallopeptidase [Streptomyces candidus]GHH44595.1 membrane protein [Streptomyces candidus]